MTNYDVIRVERKTAELAVINSFVENRPQNREETTSGDYFCDLNDSTIQTTAIQI